MFCLAVSGAGIMMAGVLCASKVRVPVNGDGLVSREEFRTLLTETHLPDSLDQYDPRFRHGV